MAELDTKELEVERLDPNAAAGIAARSRLTKEQLRATAEDHAAGITQGILGQAVAGGFEVDEKTLEAVQQAQQPEPEPEVQTEPPPPDPVEAIVDSLQAEQADTTEDVSEAMADEQFEDDEIQTPDFEAEAEKELLDEEIAASGEEGFSEDWDPDPEVNEARKRALVAEKKAAFYERITAQRELKKWEAEADKHYPMWRARGEITATSKRGFLKAAKESHEAVKPFVTAAVKTREQQIEEERASLKAEAKQEAAEAWGKPTVATNIADASTRDYKSEWNEARKNQDLPNMLRIKREYREATGGGELGE